MHRGAATDLGDDRLEIEHELVDREPSRHVALGEAIAAHVVADHGEVPAERFHEQPVVGVEPLQIEVADPSAGEHQRWTIAVDRVRDGDAVLGRSEAHGGLHAGRSLRLRWPGSTFSSMPAMQTALSAMNRSFASDAIGEIDPEAFLPGSDASFVDSLRRVPGLEMDEAIFDYLGRWPSALQRAAQAVVWENLTRGATVPMTFAWTPGYDYSVTFYDIVDTAETTGGITVLFTSRYPRDAHPVESAGA